MGTAIDTYEPLGDYGRQETNWELTDQERSLSFDDILDRLGYLTQPLEKELEGILKNSGTTTARGLMLRTESGPEERQAGETGLIDNETSYTQEEQPTEIELPAKFYEIIENLNCVYKLAGKICNSLAEEDGYDTKKTPKQGTEDRSPAEVIPINPTRVTEDQDSDFSGLFD